ncbi:MAG: hypothetical protein P1U36_02885 [Legionellaceae bacterium]|nr:hypothetical protein [Legionellaceae bacterium]
MPTTPNIKTEHSLTLADLKECLIRDIKMARDGDNTQDNCGHLTAYILGLIKYYHGLQATKPPPPSSANSSDGSTDAMLTRDRSKHVTASSAVRSAHGLNSTLPDQPIIDLNNTRYPLGIDDYSNPTKIVAKTKVSNTVLTQTLKTEATKKNKMLFGEIALASQAVNRPGHLLAFVATSEAVFYIDAQFYDGIDKTGAPCFDDICAKYQFSDIRIHNQIKFQPECFYLTYGTIENNLQSTTDYSHMLIKEEPKEPTRSTSAADPSSTTSMQQRHAAGTFKPNTILRLESTLSIEKIQTAVASLTPDASLFLHPRLSIEQIQTAAAALKSGDRLCLDSMFSIQQIDTAAASLTPDAYLFLYSELSIQQIKTAAAALKSGARLCLDSMFSIQQIKTAAASLNQGADLLLHPRLSIQQIETATTALKPGAHLLLCPELSIEAIQAAAAALKPSAVLRLDRELSIEQLEAVGSALAPGAIINLCGLDKEKNLAPLINSLPSSTRLLLDTKETVSYFLSIHNLILSNRGPNSGITLLVNTDTGNQILSFCNPEPEATTLNTNGKRMRETLGSDDAPPAKKQNSGITPGFFNQTNIPDSQVSSPRSNNECS